MTEPIIAADRVGAGGSWGGGDSLGPRGGVGCIRRCWLGSWVAPTFAPARRRGGRTRRALGRRPVFNVLGPLANPAHVRHQALGGGARGLAPLMIRVLRDLGHERALVFYGEDGLDELTTTGPSHVFQLIDSELSDYELDPQDLGIKRASAADLLGGTPAENARLITDVLNGEAGPRRDVVLLNGAAALIAAGRANDWRQALAQAADSLDSRQAAAVLEKLVKTSQSATGT